MSANDQKGKTNTMLKIGLSMGWFLSLSLLYSCAKGPSKPKDKIIQDSIEYRMYTRGVSTMISDSGMTRYKLEAEEWYIFEGGENPQWKFPSGFHVEQFDTLFATEAEVNADSAIFFIQSKTWKLMGHVNIQNLTGQSLKSDLIFWDQKYERIYTNDSVWLNDNGMKLDGYGFESNQSMTKYTFYNSKLFIPEERIDAPNQVEKTDSTSKQTKQNIDQH